jgi:hypothetical protein
MVTQTVQNQTADLQLDVLIFFFVTVGQNVKTQNRRGDPLCQRFLSIAGNSGPDA